MINDCKNHQLNQELEVQEVQYTALTANGASGTETTDKLIISFSPGIPGLTEANFGIAGATKGTVVDASEGAGISYVMNISDITVYNEEPVQVSVAVIPQGYSVDPHARSTPVFVKGIVWDSAIGNGQSNVTTTNKVTLTFTPAVPGLKLSDFEVTGATATALTDTTPAGTTDSSTYVMDVTLDGDIGNNDNITIDLISNFPDYTVCPNTQTVVVYVHQPDRIWSQVLVADDRTFTLNKTTPVAIPFNTPYIDDSRFMHAENGGIVLDEPGDYEVTLSLNYIPNKDGYTSFNLAPGYPKAYLGVMADSYFAGQPVMSTKTVIFPDCEEGLVFNLTATSLYNETQLNFPGNLKSSLTIKRIEPEENVEPESYGSIRYISFKNDAPLRAKVKISATWRDDNGNTTGGDYWLTHSYNDGREGQTIKGDISKAEDKKGNAVTIPTGASIKVKTDVDAGNDNTADQDFTYSAASTGTAKFSIHGTTVKSHLEYEGIE
jgi:hypothetical protein